jgi:DNA polymerase III alpha subunit
VHRTSNGRRFSYFSLSDPTGMTEVNIFNESIINESRDMLESNQPITVKCEARRDEGGMRIITNEIMLLTDYIKDIKSDAELFVSEETIDSNFINNLKELVVNDNLPEDEARMNLKLSLNIKSKLGFDIKIKITDSTIMSSEKFDKIKLLPNTTFSVK